MSLEMRDHRFFNDFVRGIKDPVGLRQSGRGVGTWREQDVDASGPDESPRISGSVFAREEHYVFDADT